MSRFETVVTSLSLALLAAGLALVLLLPPPFTQAMSSRYSEPSGAETASLAEASRRLVVSGDDAARAVLSEVMTDEAISHLDDVGVVIGGAIAVTAVLLAVLGVWILTALHGRRYRVLAASFRSAAWLAAGTVIAVGLFAVIDFDTFFSAFHGLFFAPGTWVFPSDSVLIRLFPEPFWIGSAVAWAALILVIAAGYAALSRVFDARGRREAGAGHGGD